MKLSKKGAAIQRAIHDALASGNRRRASRYGGQVALGGLLVGLAATVAGCGERHSPAVMGRLPDSRYQENAKNENTEEFVTEGEMPGAEEVPAQEPEPSKTNAVREVQGKGPVVLGEPMPLPGKPLAPPLTSGQYRVKHGDTLTKIAKTHGTTVAELKGLNSFDDKRANSLISGEIIKVPSQPNAMNKDRNGALSVKGRIQPKK